MVLFNALNQLTAIVSTHVCGASVEVGEPTWHSNEIMFAIICKLKYSSE